MTAPITVLIADDQDLIREALRALLAQNVGIEVVGEARNGLEAITETQRLKPDVVLMDVRMPGLSGYEATEQIRRGRATKHSRVLILTTFEDGEVVRACLRAGAVGFIGKGSSSTTLIEAIYAVHAGDSPLSARATRTLIEGIDGSRSHRSEWDPQLSRLTARELEIVALVGRGIGNTEIANLLSISPATAKTHVRNVMKKLGTRDRAQLVAFAHRADLVD